MYFHEALHTQVCGSYWSGSKCRRKHRAFLFCCRHQQSTFKTWVNSKKPNKNQYKLQGIQSLGLQVSSLMIIFVSWRRREKKKHLEKVWTFSSSHSHGDVMSAPLFQRVCVCFPSEKTWPHGCIARDEDYSRLCFSAKLPEVCVYCILAALWGPKYNI